MRIEKAKELRDWYNRMLLEDCIPFWMRSDLIDREYGGFLTCVDREGKLYSEEKSVWFQGRCLWTFASLCNRYGKHPEWVEAAEKGAAFLKEHCIDTDGRMFFIVSRNGEVLRKRRYFASESFLVTGFAEYYAMTGNPDDLALAENVFYMMYSIYRDPENDPFQCTPKYLGKAGRMHSMSEVMELMYTAQPLRRLAVQRREKYDRIIAGLIEDIFALHYKPELECVLENVNSDGSIIDTPVGREINPGHCIENAWFLLNYASLTNDTSLQERALSLIRWSLKRGWDEEYGGIRYFCDVYDRPTVQLEHDMKLWWVHNEALIATLAAHLLTGDSYYEEWFDRIQEYSFSHFPDKEHGEWYGYLHRDGTVSHTIKGSIWKGPYHYPRCLMLCELLLDKLCRDEHTLPNML